MPHTKPRSPPPTSPTSGRPARPSAAPEALIVFQSLQLPEALFTVIDRVPDHEPAAAEGRRIAILSQRIHPRLASATPPHRATADFKAQHLAAYVERCTAWRRASQLKPQLSPAEPVPNGNFASGPFKAPGNGL
ncbi:hypothetical protein GCM10009727_28370 [Actinomadura napierensis]|uniref:Uncharacterized protein n=1 Tax=Actinomadura napierensis TaxID=267854 RepID=A0ABN2YZQ4_9ACTN